MLDVRLGTPVCVGDVRVGVVTAVLADEAGERAFGLEVSTRDGERWFLPWAAADIGRDAVQASSALVFGGPDQLDAYARRGACFVREADGDSRVTEGVTRPRHAVVRVSAGVPAGRTRS